MDQQRRSFTVTLQPDNALDGLLALNRSGKAADDPLMRELNMTAIAEITADGAMDVDELKYLVERVGALNEVYEVDKFEALMRQVEENYQGAYLFGVLDDCMWWAPNQHCTTTNHHSHAPRRDGASGRRCCSERGGGSRDPEAAAPAPVAVAAAGTAGEAPTAPLTICQELVVYSVFESIKKP